MKSSGMIFMFRRNEIVDVLISTVQASITLSSPEISPTLHLIKSSEMNTPRTDGTFVSSAPGTKPPSSAGSIAAAVCCVLICIAVFTIAVYFWKRRSNRINRVRMSVVDTNKLSTNEVGHHNEPSKGHINTNSQNEETNNGTKVDTNYSKVVSPNVYHASIKERQPNNVDKVGTTEEGQRQENNDADASNPGSNPPEDGGFVDIYAHSPYGGRRFDSIKETSGQNTGARIYHEIEETDSTVESAQYATSIVNNSLCVPQHAAPTRAPTLPARDHEGASPKFNKDKKAGLPNSRANPSGIIVKVTDASENKLTKGDDNESKAPSFRVECMAVAYELLRETNNKDDTINDSQEQQIKALDKTDTIADISLKDDETKLPIDSENGCAVVQGETPEKKLVAGRIRPELLRDDSLCSQEFY